ncbi:MAG TPA: hypothetical protein VJ527_01935 [Rhodanobacter sp.]|nr:hypothetical protein [Rhodanobacter sp.]
MAKAGRRDAVIERRGIGGDRTARDRLVPYCMFTDPELGQVGLNASAARRAGTACRVARISMAVVLRTWTISATGGYLVAISD